MFSLFNIMIAILWLLSAVIDYTGYCYIWQLKWYRLDRFKDYLSTEQGKRFLFRYDIAYRSFFALIIFFWPINDILALKYIVFFFLILDFLNNGYRYISKKTRIPIPSLKALLIVITGVLLEGLWVFTAHDWDTLLFAMILRLFIVSAVVGLYNLMSWLTIKYYIVKAQKKMMLYPNLICIGITGSYGKTSVKEFLYQILSTKYKVIRTPKNINSDIGITQFILKTDFENVDYFIVEIGAYNKGDVKLVCDIIKPKIGILTAINEQHLSLFGSLKNIQSTKYELLRSLPKDGLAITNSDNPYCREFLDELQTQVFTFGLEEKFNPTCRIIDAQILKEGGISAKGRWTNGEQVIDAELTTHITGKHNLLNIAACVPVCSFIGMHRSEIISAIEKLTDPETSIKIFAYGNSTIIDDSYNSNPQGFKAALDVLNGYPSDRKRIVITRGMLELGEKSNELHEQIGGEIAFVADELVIITADSIEPLRRGAVGQKYNTSILIITQPQSLLEYVQSLKKQGCVILIENRIPALIQKELKK